MQVNPVYSDDASEQQVVGFEVTTGPQGGNRDGTYRGWENDYFEDSEGNSHHRYENSYLKSEQDEGIHFNNADYAQALLQSTPGLSQALKWADGGLDAEFVQYLNQEFNSGDPDKMNPAIELLMEQFNEFGNRPVEEVREESEDPEVDELSEEEAQILTEAVEMLEGQEPEGEYMADQWQEAVQQAEASGDETYAMVAAATAAFHAGDVTAEEAIDYCLNNGDLKDLSRVYQHLLNQ